MAKGKKYVDATKKFDRDQLFTPAEAVELVRGLGTASFDESIELAMRLGVDPRKADQIVRGTVVLPHGTGKTVRVYVAAQGEKEKEANDAGADFAGSDELVQKVSEGFMDFDRVIATPDMMGAVGKLGRVLGPRGLMPNPKVGSVTPDVAKAVREAKAGKVEYRVDKAGVIHCRVGRVSFDAPKLAENALALVRERAGEKAWKGEWKKGSAASLEEVLKWTLPALVTHRTVEGVVDEQELHDAALCLVRQC